MHAVLLELDKISLPTMIHSYKIYVGNSEEYDDSKNTYCGTINDVPKEQSKGGDELFCNTEGRYIHIVNNNDPVL